MIRLLYANLLLTIALGAAPILTLNPTNGALSGAPGTTVWWGFTIVSDPLDWIVFTAVQANLAVPGTFTDQLSNFVANNAFALPPQAADWTELSTPGTAVVAGALAFFDIAPLAPFGITSGSLIISYDRYDADPFVAINASFLGSGEFIRAVSIQVTSGVEAPEPGTLALIAIPLALGLALRKRSQATRL